MLLAVAAACAGETVEVPGETVVVEKIVTETVEVPGETVVVEKEVIKTVEVPGETVTKEVVKEVMVPGETVVVKEEVIKTVEIPGQTVVKEVVKTVEVPGETVVVEKEVVKTVEVPGQTVVVEKVVVQEVPGKSYVTDPTTGKPVLKPQYGGTLTSWFIPFAADIDPYSGWPDLMVAGVVEKLGIGNWGIDRDEWDFVSGPVHVSAITGRLAESWEMPDDKTFIFHIRPGVYWHNKPPMNGRELTADDIEYNFHRMLGLGKFTDAGPTPFGGAANLTGIPFESITATDGSTVVMKLKEPHLPALKLILLNTFVYIMPPEVIEQYGDVKDWRNLVGTGPMMLTDYVDGSSVTWDKNPDYWGYDEKYPQNRLPYVDQQRMLLIQEIATRLAAVRTGKVDFYRWITDLESVQNLKRTNPEIAAHPIYYRSSDSFALDVRKPPFDDINVRRAMQMALDNETVAATLGKGLADPTPHGYVGGEGYIVPFDEWPEEVKQYYRYAPEAAEKLLDEAGYPRGADGIRFKTVLNTISVDSYDEIAVSYWDKIGIDVEIQARTYAEHQERVFSRTYEGIVVSTAANIASDSVEMARHFHSDSILNRPGSQWPEVDAMVDAALAATTVEEQQRLIAEADMYMIEKHWQIFGPISPAYSWAQPWVIGYNGEYVFEGEYNTVYARLWIDHELKAAMGY